MEQQLPRLLEKQSKAKQRTKHESKAREEVANKNNQTNQTNQT